MGSAFLRTSIFCVMTAAIMVPGSARAADASATRRALARELIQLVTPSADQTVAGIMSQLPDTMGVYKDLIQQWARKVLLAPELMQSIEDIYVETYTEDELRQMRAYYQTPLGKKLLATMPEVMQKCMTVTNRVMMRELPGLFEILDKKRRDDLRARQLEVH